MPNLEWTKYEQNFKKMKQGCPDYEKEEWFPSGVNFKERTTKDNYRKEMFEAYKERIEDGMWRSIDLVD